MLLIVGSSIVSADLWAMTRLDENSPFLWVLAAHATLSIGLALLLTPLFTASLSVLAIPAAFLIRKQTLGAAESESASADGG